MTIVFRHFWLLAIAVTCFNGLAWWKRAQKRIEANPQSAAGYRRLIRGWFLWGNLPWLVMGAGTVIGGVPSMTHFFNPRNGPWVVAWFVTVVLLWVLTIVWLFVYRGAEQLAEHPGIVNVPGNQPRAIKAYLLLSIAGGAVALLLMIFADIRVP